MAPFVPVLISNSQSAFFTRLSITNNAMLADDLMQGNGRRHFSPRYALKVDLQKAFDSLQWGFLLSILRAQGFPEKFLKWNEVCLTTPRFSISLNGNLVGFFRGRKGIRQGDPFFPYLLLNVAVINALFKYHTK
ncbi:uncharacterized protein [Gossypium hirsutum]|uniref:Reverse transcriptase domain-containing protein n=1 Tax=Gossypium hirsutum TaxID=3635 RepID=A0A1U8IS09_GOSHI|nr:uncharacterized protein LOC107898191 [Gossypium hirsutum]